MTARTWSCETLNDTRRFVLASVPRGELRGLLCDLLDDATMQIVSSPNALRELADHESAAESRRDRDPNEDRTIAACRVVRDIVNGVKRCPYCREDVREPAALPGCSRFNTHEVSL